MKKIFLLIALLSLTARAEDPACNNRAVKVMVRQAYAQELITHAISIDSIPLEGRVLSRAKGIATVEIAVLGDLEESGHDAFDVAMIVKGFRAAHPEGMGIRRIVADVCYPPKKSGTDDSDGDLGTIGHK